MSNGEYQIQGPDALIEHKLKANSSKPALNFMTRLEVVGYAYAVPST